MKEQAPALHNKRECLILMKEYDKMKIAGLTNEEIFLIAHSRAGKPQKDQDNDNDTENGDEIVYNKKASYLTLGKEFGSHIYMKEDNIRVVESANEMKCELSQVQTPSSNRSTPIAGLCKTKSIMIPFSLSSSLAKTQMSPSGKLLRDPQYFKKPLAVLIDDSPVAAKVGAKVLQVLNFEVVSMLSAETGFEYLKANAENVSIVFLDVVMPNVDGVECLEWIKGEPRLAHIPIYMLSGLDDETLTEVCMESGADGMVLKPLNAQLLTEIMEKHKLGHHSAPPTPTMAYSSDTGNKTSSNMTLLGNSSRVSSSKGVLTSESRGSDSSATTPSKLSIIEKSVIGNIANPFRLIDSDMQEYSYPTKLDEPHLLAFFPTIFMKDLYKYRDSLLRWMIEHKDFFEANRVNVLCISSDLPMTLQSGKDRYEIPYRLLSDASLSVTKQYVGTFDIIQYMSDGDSNGNISSKDKKSKSSIDVNMIRTSLTSHLGLILIDGNRKITQKWIGRKVNGNPDLKCSLPDIYTWIKDLLGEVNTESLPSQVYDSTCSSDSLIDKDLVWKGKCNKQQPDASEEEKNSSSRSNLLLGQVSEAMKVDETKGQQKIVLLVDDSSVSSRVVTRKLDSAGYIVRTAYNGLIALDMIKKNPHAYGVVVADVVMPVMVRNVILYRLTLSIEIMLYLILCYNLHHKPLSRGLLCNHLRLKLP